MIDIYISRYQSRPLTKLERFLLAWIVVLAMGACVAVEGAIDTIWRVIQ